MKTNYRKSGTAAANVGKALTKVFEGEAKARLFGAAMSLCGNVAQADELVQESCYRALKAARDFDASKPIVPWLMRIVRNGYLDSRRTAKPGLSPDSLLLADGSEFGLERAVRAERAANMAQELGSLRRSHRDVVVLHDLLGLTYSKAAKCLGVPVGTVRSRLSRARDVLRRQLGRGV